MNSTWGRTETGTVYHSFKADGTAICRSNIKLGSNGLITEEKVNQLLARAWGVRTQGVRKCSTCETKEIGHRNRVEASMAPSTGEGDHLPPATEIVSTTDTEENTMGLEGRRTTGPLTPRQIDIIELLAGGRRQKEAASEMTVASSYISNEMSVITAKMRAGTAAEAIALYTRAKVWREVAARLRGGLVPVPIDEAEAHANHVLIDLAAEYWQAAESALPQ